MLGFVTCLPNGIDTSVPHPARVYDYWLGGKDNFEADRRAAEAGYQAFPGVLQSVRANRAFLARVVRYLVTEAGVRQFLDVGSGLPTASNTHEIAQEKAPESRVVYVDNDPVVLMHARVMLQSSPEGRTDYHQADARDPEFILEKAAATLDFREPVAVIMLGVLHFLRDDEQVAAITAAFSGAVAPGSHLAISHAASDIEAETMADFARSIAETGFPDGVLRDRAQVTRLFSGLDLIAPGVVPVSRWRPDTEQEARAVTTLWGGVARKPLSPPLTEGRRPASRRRLPASGW
jgi:O-methyltransferase involved in polyketide biosynthesis